MKGAARRLAAAVEAIRAGGGTATEQQTHQHELIQALFALQRLWKPELLTNPTPAKKRSSKSNAALFQLLLATLIVYSGGNSNSAGSVAAGAGAGAMGVSLLSSSANTSECIHRLVCDLLVRSFDYSVVPTINDNLLSKNMSLYIKVSLVMVVCRLPLQDAMQFLPDVVTLVSKNIRAADYYLKQCLLESVSYALEGDSRRLVPFHAEALKIVAKTYQDKIPEVRIAAAKLLQVVAECTSASTNAAAGNGSSGTGTSQGSNGNGNGNGAPGSGGGSAAIPSGGGSNHGGTLGVSLDAILQITAKGMDDDSPEARRAYSVVVGTVLAKYATSSSGETEIQTGGGESNGASTEEDAGGRHSLEQDGAPGKPKLAFKLHVPGMSTISLPLSRRKAAMVNFSTIPNVVLYFKDMVTSKYLSSNPNQSHGGILSSYSIALCSMFERLPPDSIGESQIHEVIDAILAILDHPFALGDLTRARNAVGFVLRYGVNVCLTERQQEALLGAYLQKLKDESKAPEPNHHKTLSVLVELSHMFHSMGEGAVSHAHEASCVFQGLLSHAKQSVRFQAAVALSSLVTAIPYRLKHALTECIGGLRDTAEFLMHGGSDAEETRNLGSPEAADDGQDETNDGQSKIHLYAIQGRSAAIAHVLRAIKLENKGGLSQTVMDDIFMISEELVESQFLSECADSVWLTCTRAGWTLVGSLVAMNDEQWIKTNLEKLLNLFLKSSVLHNRESSLELLRIEAAVIALSSFLCGCQSLTADLVSDHENDINLLASHVLHVYLMATQDALSNPLKRRGQVARYRLVGWIINCFSMLPPIYSDSYIVLLDLIAEFTSAQSLTNLRHSSLIPAKTTFLQSVLSSDDNELDMVTLSRLVPGDHPSPLYSRELNHSLGLQQRENALTDTELEVQYLDTFWRSVYEKDAADGVYRRASCSPFTYVRLVDASVLLFGRLFHFIPEDLQLRCLQHYAGVLTDARVDCEVNVCSLLFSVIAEGKRLEKGACVTAPPAPSSTTSWQQQMQSMLCEMISSENSEVRRGAGEALGTLALLIGEDHCKGLIIELEKRLVVDKLSQGASNSTFGSNSDLDVSILSAGAAFALACIKRACGSRISVDTGLIFRFAGECSQPLRTWILHSWSIVLESVNSTGGDYEQYVNSTFSLMESHLLAGFVYSKVNKKCLRWQTSTKVAMGRIINDVVATLGPELGSSNERLNDFYSFWTVLRQDGDTRLELEFFKFLEQVVVFAPSRFQTADLRYILRIISDTALLNSALPSSLTTPQDPEISTLSPPSGGGISLASFGALKEPFGQNGLISVGVFTNGWSRSILQNVGLSCIRTLVERDPSLIRRHNLLCLLFSALHVEYNELTWVYLPGLNGMWDVLSFAFADATSIQRNGVGALRSTLLALLNIEGGDHDSAEPCLWALLCRSIAIGESANTFLSGAGAEQLMMSPKGVNLGLQMADNPGNSQEDGSSSWSPGLDLPKTDANSLASAAIAAQVETWRATKAGVGELIAMMPPLSRQVRHFAVECVLRVFELMATSTLISGAACPNKQLHFDLIAARRYFFDTLSAGGIPSSNIGNFLCMYLDEFVTLACHVATTSAEGDELLMFQCVGLRLMNILVNNFSSARDPEVATGEAYLLDPYRAQLSSAIRHALKQVQVEPSLPPAHNTEVDSSERSYFYAPLLLEAHAIAGKCIEAHLTQDKVALGRILRAVVTQDYGHSHYIGDEVTRTSLSLANLTAVAGLLTSSIREAIAQQDARDDERRAIAVSPLVKAMTNGLSSTMEYLFKCWMDSTFSYGVVMQGRAQWPQLDATTSNAALLSGEPMLMPALRIPLPSVVPLSAAPMAVAADSNMLRTLYKRYWPQIANAMAALEVYLPDLITPRSTAEDNIPKWSSVLLSCAVFHVNASIRDRMEDDDELSPVLRTIPLLLRASAESPVKRGGASPNEFPTLLTTAVNTLMFASRRCVGSARIEALKAIFLCLSRDKLEVAQDVCRSDEEDGERCRSTLLEVVGQAGLCPTNVLCQLCEARKQIPLTPRSRRYAIVNGENDKHVLEIVKLATAGIVLLHTTEEARSWVVRSGAIVKLIIRDLVSADHSLPVREAAVALHRASTESILALARTLEANGDTSEKVLEEIQLILRRSFNFVSEWLKDDVKSAPAYALQIAANYAVNLPACIQDDAVRFHAEVAEISSGVLALPSHEEETGDKKQHLSTCAELLRRVQDVVKKLVDARQISNANRYLVAFGPFLVNVVGTLNGYPETTEELALLDAAEGLLRLLTSRLDDQHGVAFVHMLLPRLAAVLSHPAPSTSDSAATQQVSEILSRLLLCFAQTHATAFKEAVAAMTPSLRDVLQNALRRALTGSSVPPQPNTQPSFAHGGGFPAPAGDKKLDLSRYN